MPLDYNEIRQLLVTIAQTDIEELTLKSDDFELKVRKHSGASQQLAPSTDAGGAIASAGAATTGTAQLTANELEAVASRMVDTTGTAAKQLAAVPSVADKKWVEVSSPMVGTFYRAPAPAEPPFVEVGDRVRSGQTVCIIEAMKLMNEIEAEVTGQVVEILVGNGEPVEYGQPLIRINPE